jgi:hypothetical protein
MLPRGSEIGAQLEGKVFAFFLEMRPEKRENTGEGGVGVNMADESAWATPALVAELREAGAASPEGLAYIFSSDQDCLQRFLRARRGDVPKALAMLLAHQAWRREETPWWPRACCPLEHIVKDWQSCKAYLSPQPDASGSTVAFVRAALHDKNEARLDLKRFISFLNDEAIARLDGSKAVPRPSQMTIIVSFTGFGYNAGFDVNAGMLIIQTLSNHFPERLKKIVMTNTCVGPPPPLRARTGTPPPPPLQHPQ